MTRPAAVHVSSLTQRYLHDGVELEALREVTLDVTPGSFTALVGPSGCGKSTLFNVIAGLEPVSQGRVAIDGESDGLLGRSAYMPQRDALLNWRRVLENVTLPLEIAGHSRREARRRALPLLERFGLGEFARAWPWQLSGGMRHRVAFVRTVIAEPSLVLLDEPFGALDGLTRADLQDWVAALWATNSPTVLLVTHDVSEAVYLADRVVVLSPRPGTVHAVLDIDLERPRRPEVRESQRFSEFERRIRHELRRASTDL